MDRNFPHPRIYFDGNSQLADRSYALVQGALDDLRSLGLSPETVRGMRLSFVQEDVGPDGEPDALIFNGTTAHSSTLGHVVPADPGGARWLSDVVSNGAKPITRADAFGAD